MDNNHPQSFVGFDPTIQGILEYLEHHLPGYPFLTATDTLFVEELQRDFPHLDILSYRRQSLERAIHRLSEAR